MSAQQLQLDIETAGGKLSTVGIDAETERKLKRLRRRVFTFSSSSADEKIFTQKILDYLQDKTEFDSLHKLLWHWTWVRNDEGKFSKYLYFNERIQKLYLDRDFYAWAKLICQMLNEELAKQEVP